MSTLRFDHAVVVIAVLAVTRIVTACVGTTSSTSGTATPADGGGTTGSSCNDLAGAARSDVAAVLDAHASCTQASDCKSISLSASCFDSCSRAIRVDGEAAFKAAQDKANQTQCVQFTNQGCKVTIPPCTPPTAVTCQNGTCSGG
jgi:hypothetical protein